MYSFRSAAGRRLFGAAALVLIIAGVAVGVLIGGRHSSPPDVATHPVHYEHLDPTLVVRGDISAAESTDIFCRVRSYSRNSTSATTIKWIVDDGASVKKGQTLVEFDDAGFQDDLETRRGPLEAARSAWILADQNFQIVASQNQGDLEAAKVAVVLNKLDLEKYTQGDYQQCKKDILSRLALAESDLDMWRDRAGWSERMTMKGYLSSTQSRVDHIQVQNSRILLDKTREEYRVLEKYTKKRAVRDLQTKLQEAEDDLVRIGFRARAKEAQANADRLSKQRVYLRLRERFQDIEDEIKKCVVAAPHDGLVIYSVPFQVWSGSGAQPAIIAQGEPVREGQRIMTLPNLAKMQVNVRIHEALVSHIRGEEWQPTHFTEVLQAALLANVNCSTRLLNQFTLADLKGQFHDQNRTRVFNGQPAQVRIDALPNRVFQGHVKQVATLASQPDWSMPDVRVYRAEIAIDDPVENIKPDMSAEVTVFVDEPLDHVLAVPIESLVHGPDQGKHCTCYVVTPQGTEERDVVVGQHTEQMAEVQSGLHEADEVVLHPKALGPLSGH